MIEKVYFDNCLIGAIVKSTEFPAEISALRALMREHLEGRLLIVASTEALSEIEHLPNQYQGDHIAVYRQLKQLPASGVSWIEPRAPSTPGTDPDYSALRGILPGEMDRRHVLSAVKNEVRRFATVDEDSMLKHRLKLQAVFPSIVFGKPTEIAAALSIRTT